MTHFDYDLFVIGAGSGGVRAARLSSQYGAKVAIAEEARVGGTCVNIGCVPKKLFVYASQFAESFEDAAGFGWTVGKPEFNWQLLIANKDKEIERLNGAYSRTLANAGVTYLAERAEVVGPHTVRLISSGQTITARTLLLATGTKPYKPEIPGAQLAITSDEAFYLPELPKSVIIIGAGYIALEFAGIFNGLGVQTKIIYRGEKVLRGFDEDLRDAVQREMTTRGIDLLLSRDVTAIAKSDSGYEVTLSDGSKQNTDLVMYATGRHPNTKNLGLEGVGIELGKNGAVLVNNYSQSSVPSIYAVGDITDRKALTPVAIREGAAFAETLFNNKPQTVTYDTIPTAVFSQPEIGTVGLTETEARLKYGEIDIYKTEFRPMKHTLSGRQTKILMKLVVDAKTDKVLGCHILGEDAAEIIQAVGIAVVMGATKADFDATVALHPSAAEELVTLKQKWTGK